MDKPGHMTEQEQIAKLRALFSPDHGRVQYAAGDIVRFRVVTAKGFRRPELMIVTELLKWSHDVYTVPRTKLVCVSIEGDGYDEHVGIDPWEVELVERAPDVLAVGKLKGPPE